MARYIFLSLLLSCSFMVVSPMGETATPQLPYQQGVTLAPAAEILQAGSVIPATLVTPMDSDNLNAPIIAIVRNHVYDSVTGKSLLIPAGSKLIGEALGLQGKRIDVAFTRLIFPNGHSVLLPEYKSVDGVGYAGLKDKYTRHTWLKMKNILTGALFSGAITATSHKSGGTDKENRSAGEEAVAGAISQILNGISNEINKNNEIQPTGTVREGYQFNVLLHVDIRVKPYKSS